MFVTLKKVIFFSKSREKLEILIVIKRKRAHKFICEAQKKFFFTQIIKNY